jgi:hypothetical protein
VTLREALAALFVAALLAPSASLAGQSVGTATGSIVGTVRDATGAVLPDVTVTISGDPMMGSRTTLTNTQGRYGIAALPPGQYTLSFALDGFRTVVHEGIRVGLGFTQTIDVALDLAKLPERVTVLARGGVLDRHSTGITVTFDSRRLADLPSSRSMFALLALSPAVEVARIEVGGSSGAAGAPYAAYGTRGFNRPMVEGISVTGIFPTGFTLDYGSFEEVSVLTGAHGAEWPTPGVHMQFISKSGGNRYRGTLYADYEDRRWQSFNIDEQQIGRGVQSGGGLLPRDVNRLWDYYDVNGDVGGFVIRDKVWWYSSIREQEISARLVNFPVTPHRTRLTNYTGKGTYALTPSNRFIAFAQAGRNHQPNRLDPFGPTGSRLTAATAINASEESTANQRALGWVWKGEWNAVVDDKLLFEMRTGQFGANQRWEPNSAAPRVEDVATLRVRGGNRDWQGRFRRDQLHGALSYFHDGWSGGHHIKIGGEVFRTIEVETWRTAYPGNVLHVLRNNTPIEVYLFQTPSRSESGLWTYSAYASDSWRLNNRVTLNMGVRFDRYRVFLPAQEHPAGNPAAHRFAAVHNVIDWNLIVPRIGAVYDPTGRGKTLVKVNYGRYRLAPGTVLGFNVNPNSNVWWERYEWTDPDGSGAWEAGEEFHALERRGGVAVESLDPELELPVLDEVAGWIERELPGRIGVRTGVVWRGEHQHFVRQNANQPFTAFTVPVTVADPGPDGLVGTVDDGPFVRAYDLRTEIAALPPVNIVRNVPGSSSHYWTWAIGASRRADGRWTFGAGFAHTWHRDQSAGYSGQAVRNNVYPLTPNDLSNAGTGGRHEFRTWTAKAYGTYEGPWGVRATPVLRHQAGQPFGRTFVTAAPSYGTFRMLAEPVGTWRMDNITIVDVRVEKRIRLHNNWRLAPFVDVFNLLNANPEQNSIWSSGPSFLRPVTIVPPRIARIGAKLEW